MGFLFSESLKVDEFVFLKVQEWWGLYFWKFESGGGFVAPDSEDFVVAAPPAGRQGAEG